MHGKGAACQPAWDGKGPPLPSVAVRADGGIRAGHSKEGKGGARGEIGKGTADAAAGEHGGPKGSWAKPPTIVDDEGYELVQRRKVRSDVSGVKGSAPAPGHDRGGNASAKWTGTRCRWSDVDDDSDDDVGLEEEMEDDAREGDDGANGDDAPDPTQLRATFEAHAKAVRELQRRGTHGPALDTLRLARDRAEQEWRSAKPPAPLPRRMEWAEAKMRKAQAALTRVRLELDAFDAETDRRRADLNKRIQEAQQWYDWRRQQLGDLHEEAAGMATGRRAAAASAGGAVGEARRKIRGHVLPEMQAILEEVQEGTPLHGRLALALAGLADAEAGLGDQGEREEPPIYHMDDEDSQYGEWEDEDQGKDDTHGAGEDWREETPQGNKPPGWRPEGASRWTRTTNPNPMGGDAQVGPSRGGTQGTRTTQRDGDGQARRGLEAPGATGDAATAKDGDDSAAGGDPADGTERAGKHRRRQSEEEAKAEERAASDARRARELQERLESASAAQVRSYAQGNGGFGSEAALSVAAQSFVQDVLRAQAQANEMGVEARTEDGRALLQLSPVELQRWVRDNLEEGAVHS